MKQKLLKNITKQKGITLIALVITIIVLLILAGVSIAMLTGQNGILTQAQNASTQTEIAEAKEKAQMDIMAWQSERLENGQDATLNDETVKTILTGKDYVKELKDTSFISTKGEHEIQYSDLYTNGNNQGGGTANAGEEVTKPSTWPENDNVKAISDGAGNTIPLPIDFYYVGGTKTEGVVISDAPNDNMDNTAEGNQFVWVPVDNYDDFQRQVGYLSGNLNVTTWPSTYGEADSTGVNQYLADNSMQETDTTKQEAMAMYESVRTYGGFYIGRFEAGQEDGNLVVKKGKAVYNSIIWSANGNMQETTGTTGGAVELSRNFDSRYANQSVTSTLCYGVQWDAALNFIDPNYITNATIGTPACSEESFVRDSTGQGNYLDDESTNNPGNTGLYVKNNIYDLAGNVYEWTMESCDTSYRVKRGGGYSNSGAVCSSSYRVDGPPKNTSPLIGFRITLYL